MERKQFVRIASDYIAKGRKLHHPNMRPSEIAMSRVEDEEKMKQLWKGHRQKFAAMTPEQLVTWLEQPATPAPDARYRLDWCQCGHERTRHLDGPVARGHGGCAVVGCKCELFSWAAGPKSEAAHG